MKIKPEDFIALKQACFKGLKNNGLHPYQVQSLESAWQVFNHIYSFDGIGKKLYAYLNDNHIETALKKIFKHV